MDLNRLMNFSPRLPSLVCEIGDEGAAGGGGGAPPAGEPGAFDPEAFKSEIKDFTVRAVNGAVSTHLTRALEGKFKENNDSLLSQFKELMTANAPDPNAAAPASGGSDIDNAIKNATAPLLKQIEEQRALNERAAAQAKAERDNRMQQEEESALISALTTAGVAGPLAQAAVGVLRTQLERDSNGAIQFVAKENGPTGPYEERVAVGEGVARYLKTDDGKHFLPPRQATGSGNRGGRAPSGTPGQASDAEFVGDMLGVLGIG